MADGSLTTTQRLSEQASAIASLAKNRGAFDAALDAYIQADGDGFRYVLEQQHLLDRCELVCDWIRIKWCTVTCLRLCGFPNVEAKGPASVARLAEIVGKIANDEAMLERVIEGIQDQDTDDFAAVVKQLGFQDVCHYVCSWFCAILSERVCRIVCSRQVPGDVASPAESVRAAAAVIAKLAAGGKAIEKAAEAALRFDCEGLRKIVSDVDIEGGCHIVCEWFCTWRCVYLCLTLCRIRPPEVTNARDEIYAFAQAVGKLAPQTVVIDTLAAAVRTANAEQFDAAVKQLKYEEYCIQLCRWICWGICEEYCFCVCPPASNAIFTKIGGYYYEFDVASALGGNGLTNDNRAFFDTMRLNGGIALVDGAPQIQYRFETVPTDASGNVTGSWTAVLPAQIAATNIGTLLLPVFPFFKEVWVNGTPGPHVVNITPDVNGWITVPVMFPSPGVQFVPGSDLIELISQTLQAWPADDETGVLAGSSANTPHAQDTYYGIRMRLRNVGDATDGSDAGTCTHVAIDDTLYDNVAHHTYWDGYVGANELAVFSVGIEELISSGCRELTDSLTVLFTAAHPNLDPNGVSISLIGPGGPYAFSLSPSAPGTPGNWFGNGVPDGWAFSDLPDCAYIVSLSVNVLLTNGDSDPSPLVDQIAFCKQA
jgi:hypothetical protein